MFLHKTMDLSELPNEIILEIMKFMQVCDTLKFNCFPRLNIIFREFIKWNYSKNDELKKIVNDVKIDILLGKYIKANRVYNVHHQQQCGYCNIIYPNLYFSIYHNKRCIYCYEIKCMYNSVHIRKSEYKYLDLFPSDYKSNDECILCKKCFRDMYNCYRDNIFANKKNTNYDIYYKNYVQSYILNNRTIKEKVYIFGNDTNPEVKKQFGYGFGRYMWDK